MHKVVPLFFTAHIPSPSYTNTFGHFTSISARRRIALPTLTPSHSYHSTPPLSPAQASKQKHAEGRAGGRAEGRDAAPSRKDPYYCPGSYIMGPLT